LLSALFLLSLGDGCQDNGQYGKAKMEGREPPWRRERPYGQDDGGKRLRIESAKN
jgi:hypothetical protein